MSEHTIIGESIFVYIFLSLLFGFCAFLAGRAQAFTWRRVTTTILFGVMIAMGHRFLVFALRDADLLSFNGFVVSLIFFEIIALSSYRYYHVSRACDQYPWVYVRTSWFSYKHRD